MKLFIIAIMSLLVLSIGFAQIQEQRPGFILPDSPFYFVNVAIGNIRSRFGSEARMEVILQRLAEAEEMVNQNKIEEMNIALGDVNKHMNILRTEEQSNEIKEGLNIALNQLERIIETAPEEALAGLNIAYDLIERGRLDYPNDLPVGNRGLV